MVRPPGIILQTFWGGTNTCRLLWQHRMQKQMNQYWQPLQLVPELQDLVHRLSSPQQLQHHSISRRVPSVAQHRWRAAAVVPAVARPPPAATKPQSHMLPACTALCVPTLRNVAAPGRCSTAAVHHPAASTLSLPIHPWRHSVPSPPSLFSRPAGAACSMR